jgi:hypothetical protein
MSALLRSPSGSGTDARRTGQAHPTLPRGRDRPSPAAGRRPDIHRSPTSAVALVDRASGRSTGPRLQVSWPSRAAACWPPRVGTCSPPSRRQQCRRVRRRIPLRRAGGPWRLGSLWHRVPDRRHRRHDRAGRDEHRPGVGCPTGDVDRCDPLHDLASESPAIGPIGTELGARDCATALGVPSDAALVVDLVTHDDSPPRWSWRRWERAHGIPCPAQLSARLRRADLGPSAALSPRAVNGRECLRP